MGNICRSPSAEGFFRRHLTSCGLVDQFHVDSAGTHGYHVGQGPDSRAIREAATFDVDIQALRARIVVPEDFQRFHYILAMDHDNLDLLTRQAPSGNSAQLRLMMEFARQPGPDEVPDPYYGSQGDFNYMCHLLNDATAGLLEHIRSTAPAD